MVSRHPPSHHLSAVGLAVSRDGLAATRDGPAVSLDGSAVSLDGLAATLDGPVVSLDGPAVSLDGPAATRDWPAAHFGQWIYILKYTNSKEVAPFFKSRCSPRASPIIVLNPHTKNRLCP